MAARKRAALAGYNPDIWFHHVETALPPEDGRDTAQYVRNIYNYSKAYEYFLDQTDNREQK
jgi:membrane-bound lytic murein transglycosylase MltF